MLQYIVSLTVLRYRVSRVFFLINLNEKQKFNSHEKDFHLFPVTSISSFAVMLFPA